MHFLPIGSTEEREELVAESFIPNQQDYDHFYKIFGECFAVWSELEGRLLFLYVLLLESPNYDSVAASFYSTTGFKAKLDLVDAVIKNLKSLTSADLESWSKLYATISERSKRRNQIAHQAIFYGKIKGRKSRELFVGHPRTPIESSQLYIKDLIQIRDSFSDTSKKVFLFWQSLVNKNGA